MHIGNYIAHKQIMPDISQDRTKQTMDKQVEEQLVVVYLLITKYLKFHHEAE